MIQDTNNKELIRSFYDKVIQELGYCPPFLTIGKLSLDTKSSKVKIRLADSDGKRHLHYKAVFEKVAALDGATFSFVLPPSAPQHSLTKSCDSRHLSALAHYRREDAPELRQSTFGNFVEGNSNKVALFAARQVTHFSSLDANPLIFYGGNGFGKTHLLYAMVNAIRDQHKNKKVVFVRAHKYLQDIFYSQQNNTFDIFQEYYCSADVLLLDDIHFIANKEKTQDEFFLLFNTLFDQGRQLVFTCDVLPDDIANMEKRIQTRLSMGATILIEPPEFETRVGIVQEQAKQRNLVLSNEVATLIAGKLKTNAREIRGAVVTLHSCAASSGVQSITPEFAEKVLHSLFARFRKNISVQTIQNTVCDFYNVSFRDLLGVGRQKKVVVARQVSMFLARELTDLSYPEIGATFGKDHSTVLHSARKVADATNQSQSTFNKKLLSEVLILRDTLER